VRRGARPEDYSIMVPLEPKDIVRCRSDLAVHEFVEDPERKFVAENAPTNGSSDE